MNRIAQPDQATPAPRREPRPRQGSRSQLRRRLVSAGEVSPAGWFARTDARLAATITRARGNRLLDGLAYGLSEAANHSLLWHGINLVDLSISASKGDLPRCRRALRRSVVQGVEQALVNGPVKALVRRQRPAVQLAHPHRLRVPITSSFPSGHATAGACAAELLSVDLGHRGAWWALAAIVGWSRVHVGVHHPSDVLAGWLIGTGAARASRMVWPSRDGGQSVASNREQ